MEGSSLIEQSQERGQARDVLRAATRASHDSVDATFGRFDLSDRTSYAAFLTAHASVLPVVERWLDAHQPDALKDWSNVRRGPALLQDLAALDVAPPAPVAFDPPADAATVAGVTYVVEGSRLGGAMLAKSVGEGLPRGYLGSPMQMPVWRAFMTWLDDTLTSDGDRRRAADAALATFDHFRRAGEAVTVS